MMRSDSIKELATALCKAQAVLEGAAKDKDNPHFRSKYADLGNCWDAARKPLTDNGLSVAQFATSDDSGVKVETMLLHVSGEWMSDILTVPLGKRDAHGVGAAITYGRRFGLCAVVGIAPVDDDGNTAVQQSDKTDRGTPWTDDLRDLATEAVKGGTTAYQEFWLTLSEETRSVLVQTAEHKEFKRQAATVRKAA